MFIASCHVMGRAAVPTSAGDSAALAGDPGPADTAPVAGGGHTTTGRTAGTGTHGCR